jgi:DnaJ-domain-containing protein 1
MQDDIEAVNRKIQELLSEFQKCAMRVILERAGGNLSSLFGAAKGQAAADPYYILGLDKTASDDEVRRRYRERLRQFHPDTAGPGMEFHLQMVMAAYELIKRERGWS